MFIELQQKYNPVHRSFVWEEAGQLDGGMLGQLIMRVNPGLTIESWERLAGGLYDDICANCRYPQTILDFSDGTLCTTPRMLAFIRRFYGAITEHVNNIYQNYELHWPSLDDYQTAGELQLVDTDSGAMFEAMPPICINTTVG